MESSLGQLFAQSARLVLVGATATGKSAVAIGVAKVLAADVVSVDSMAVYRGMDIGTAKPTVEERQGVRHHMIDLVDPDKDFSVGEFRDAAEQVLSADGPLVLAGGTGLYVDTIVNGLQLPGRFPEARAALVGHPVEELYARLLELDPTAAARMEPTNERRIVRALEVTIGTGRPFSSFGPGLQESRAKPCAMVGLRWDRTRLAERIFSRIDMQLQAGLLDEVDGLRERFGARISRTARQALGYRELLAHLEGDQSFEDALAQFRTRSVAFSKRQERWFRRDPRTLWIDADARSTESIVDEILTALGTDH